MNIEWTPYSYFLKWKETGVWYYGIEYASKTKTANPANLWTTYFTSSKVVASYRKKFGDPDIIKISKTFNNAEECIAHENKFLVRTGAKNNPLSLNGHNSDGLCFKNKFVSDETRAKLTKSSKNRKWWSDDEKSVHSEFPPDGTYVRGRKHFNNKGAIIGGIKNSTKRWYHDGVREYFTETDMIVDGYLLGRVSKPTVDIEDRRCRKWFHDETGKSFHVTNEEAERKGYSPGRGVRFTPHNKGKPTGKNGSFWVTNGSEEIKLKAGDDIPIGYVRGRKLH